MLILSATIVFLTVKVVEVDDLSKTERGAGGFGSTGISQKKT